MRTLLLLRHAKSDWDDEGLTDHERPLSERGKREAPLVGQHLLERQLRPDLILCSTAKRTQKTARKVLKASGWEVPVKYLNELYLTDADTYLNVLRHHSDDARCVLVVGHNPCLESILYALVNYRSAFPTAALAHLELAIDDWQQVSRQSPAQLISLWRPE